MAGGGGTQRTVSEPWVGAQPYLMRGFQMATDASASPAQYFPGSTVVGPNALQTGARDGGQFYANRTFGEGAGSMATLGNDAVRRSMIGFTDLGQMANRTSQLGLGAIQGAFAGGPAQVGNYSMPGSVNPLTGAPQTGDFRTVDRLETQPFTPTFGRAGDLDATGAIRGMLSGQPDYAGAQRAVDAANAPILRQLNQDIIPGLNQRATFLGNPTGGIKTLNRVLPDVAERMATNAGAIMEGERQRALGQQERAANLVSQGGLSAAQLGLQGGMADANLALNNAQFGTGRDFQRFGLGLQAGLANAGLAQDAARFGLQRDTTNAGLLSDWRNQALGLGQLGGNLAQAQQADSARSLALLPQTAQLGLLPYQMQQQTGDWLQQQQQMQRDDQVDRWNFGQNAARDNAQWFINAINGMGGLGGTTTQTAPRGSRGAGAIGGGLAGAQLGSMFGPIGTGIGALGGALLGLF